MKDPALAETFAIVADAAASARDPWWIIGSAAVVLHGRTVPHVKDVDLLMSALDAEAFFDRLGENAELGTANDLFRSQVFGTWREPPIPVEIMGGFDVATRESWREVSLSTRVPVTVEGRSLFVPSLEELVALLETFGRDKDLERARLLRAG